MRTLPSRLDHLLYLREQRLLSANERAELVGLLRESGRMDEADVAERLPVASDQPQPVSSPEPTRPPPGPPQWQYWAAGAAGLLVLLAVLVPLWSARRAEHRLELCRERLGRLAVALALAADAQYGFFPGPGVDLATALEPYGVERADLSCPTGANYRLNPRLAGYSKQMASELSGWTLIYEADDQGQPSKPHRGECWGVLTDGTVSALSSLALTSLNLTPPAVVASAAAPTAGSSTTVVVAPQGGQPGPAAAGSASAAATPAAPPPGMGQAAPAPPSAAAQPAAPPPAAPAVAQPPVPQPTPAQPPALTTRPASTPAPLSTDESGQTWRTVLTMRGQDLTTSGTFSVSAAARVRFQSRPGAFGALPFKLVLTDEVGGRVLRTLVDDSGTLEGDLPLGQAGAYRLRVVTGQPFTVTVVDR